MNVYLAAGKMFNSKKDLFADKAGLTIIEMMVVLAVLGIILGISYPSFRHYLPTLRLESSVKQVLGNLRLTRQRAITEETYYCFFTEKNGAETYDIFKDSDRDAVPDAGVPVSHMTLLEGISIAQKAGGIPFWFDPKSTVVDAAGAAETCRFEVSNPKGTIEKIYVMASGFIGSE